MTISSIHGNHWATFLTPKRQFPTLSALIPTLHVDSIWPIWILFASSVNMIYLSFMMVTMPLLITWKLIFRMGVVLWMYFFPLFFLLFLVPSYALMPPHGLVVSLCSNYLTAQTLTYLPFHMTNGNVLWSRLPAQLHLSHIHLHPVQGYGFHFCSFSSMSWLCHSLFISICFHSQGYLPHFFNLCL